ncbi:MAG: penicillin-binding transpeptidase domain-containing protein [Solirubrobacteraceae bacterium]
MSIEPARGPETRMPVSPQLALRVAVLGTFALIMFGIIFFRLWYLQVLTGTEAVRQISQQETRPLPIPAPRGEILAANNQPLVGSKPTSAVQIVPSELPPGLEEQVRIYEGNRKATAEKISEEEGRLKAFQSTLHPASGRHITRSQRTELNRLQARVNAVPVPRVPLLQAHYVRLRRLFARLGRVLNMSSRRIDELVVTGVANTRYAPVTVKSDVGQGPRTVLLERENEFPAVIAQPVSTREYPFGEMAAQVVGTVGAVTKEELAEGPYKGIEQGAIVGQTGLEASYDSYLRGKAGEETVHVNAANEPVGSEVAAKQPQGGDDLKLTLQPGLQYAGEKALREQIALAQGRGKPADGGAFVALNPLNGEVLAMGSYPTYNPTEFTKPLTPEQAQALFGKEGEAAPPSGGRPLLNRAFQDGYPVGSTFKPIIAIGAMEAGILDPYESIGGGSYIEVGGFKFHNSEGTNYASTDLVHALEESSDTYFYTVGEMAYSHGDVLQRMAQKLGIGKPTGIDLPYEDEGTVPDEKWLKELDKAEEKCTRQHHGNPCRIVGEPNELWTVGQNMILAVGQGNLLTSPLQMAVAYSALVNAYRNEGQATVVTPHLGSEILEQNGNLVESLNAKYKPKKHFHLNSTYVNLIFEGIHDATVGPSGTSTSVWAGWNQQLHETFGKTGTAERLGQETQSWYMSYVADEKRPIVIAATVEQGGFGVEAAAPVARAMAGEWFNQSQSASGSAKG